QEFRSALIDRLRLKPGSRVLVTGSGLGDDVHSVLDALKGTGEVFASDLAPWLRETEYGRMAAANDPRWLASAPLALLPFSAIEVNATWVLGNCFYFI